MQTKKILLIIGTVAVVAALAIFLYMYFTKKPATVSQQQNINTSSSNGQVSNGGPQISIINPVVDQSNPYSTTKPRVNAPTSSPNQNNNPITNKNVNSSTSGSPIAYNYNQSNSSFLNQYYPDANQVINGSNGPAGNSQDDKQDQILFNTGGYDGANGTSYVLQSVPGFDQSALHVSQDNSPANQAKYLNTVNTDVASFNINSNLNLVTNSLQSQNTTTAKNNLAQATATLNKLKTETVPSQLIAVQESYIDEYQQYLFFTQQMQSFDQISSSSQIPGEETKLTNALNNLSTSMQRASNNMQTAADFVTNVGNIPVNNTSLPYNNTLQKVLPGIGSPGVNANGGSGIPYATTQ